jgi:hypothetical protein
MGLSSTISEVFHFNPECSKCTKPHTSSTKLDETLEEPKGAHTSVLSKQCPTHFSLSTVAQIAPHN